ncbi:GTPase [Salinisphaera hydrothermalis]|uniref:GTPase n=1 Tax=Salinisphaera hydrothermalis TaxID=563188 RepID=UPI00333FE737
MTSNSTQEEMEALADLLPDSATNLGRLSVLLSDTNNPKIAAFGKYNHGKSTLLNALVGQERFAASDKRETKTISEFEHDGVVWIDTPGLDADVHGEDDRKAMIAALESADILCLIHNVKAGELDKSEMALYRTLMRQDLNYRSKLILVLSQIDQVNLEDLNQVKKEIRGQLPELRISSVSAVRYARGVREDKPKFVEISGIPEFLIYLQELKKEVGDLRRKEGRRLVRKARVELTKLIEDRSMALATAKADMKAFEKEFGLEVKNAREKVRMRAESLESR